jgi:hypothetical protein
MRRVVLLFLVACGDPAPTTALFAPADDPKADDFYALPFPNDIWRTPEGTLDLSLFPTNSLLVDSYRSAAQQLDGFGLNSAIYARFEGPLDPTSVPDPAGSLERDAAIYLVDVDPDSPARGERVPIAVKFRADGTVTLGANHISARPFPGFGLADGTTYALVITDRLRSAEGGAVLAPPRFQAVRDREEFADVYGSLIDFLEESGDGELDRVVSATVFTTQRATATVPAIRRAVFATPVPTASNIEKLPGQVGAAFETYVGSYDAPNFQTGMPPYRNAPDGEIRIGSDGAAILSRMETMRFGLTVPPGTPPAAGFPIAIYSHGTGGDHLAFVMDGTALALAAQGIAVISTDQVLHGPRNPGGNAELDFFNIANPFAMRDNVLQGAADAWSQMRLASNLSIPDGNRTITFDPTRVYFFGHSQGGVTGPGFVAFEPALSGAVFSGTGGLMYLALLYKTAPINIPDLVQTFVRDDPVDEDNPSLALFQMFAERSDGANYAPLMVRRPVLGSDGSPLAPRNIFQLEGFTDTYTPNPAIEAFATALGGDIVQLPDAQELEGLALRNRTIKAAPFAHNLGTATVALAQYDQAPGSDGHYVVFDIPSAMRQAAQFLGTLSRTGTATVVAP